MEEETIQPYVAVGPSKEYGITMKKSTFDTTFLIITITFIVILVIIVGLIIYASYRVTTPPPPPPPVKINWPQTSKYYRFQSVREEDKKQIRQCEIQCDAETTCKGFRLENSRCQYFTEDLEIQNNLPRNTYVKNLSNIKILNKVYLARNSLSLPKNFWLAPNNNSFAAIPINTICKIDFVPQIVHMSSPLVGIYSTSPFDIGDALYLYKYNTISPNYYIHHYLSTDINIPNTFLYKTIYVAYIPLPEK